MPTPYTDVLAALRTDPKIWLVTGVAGFIGSNLLEALLGLGQQVIGLDNFATGQRRNLDAVRFAVGDEVYSRFTFIHGDATDLETCRAACEGVDYVLHQAALGSVPRSIQDPLATNHANVGGLLAMLLAAQGAGVQRFVFASSSSVYGDHPALPKVEEATGQPLSPYAASKAIGELYAKVFARTYGIEVVGLRYFNVFGRRQDPEGPYAAVIPRWVARLLRGEPCTIYGDGETSRDFCFVENVIQANLLAATCRDPQAVNQVYNVACSDRTTLNDLYRLIRDGLAPGQPHLAQLLPNYAPFRTGDVRHSQADISKATRLLGYAPTHTIAQGLAETLPWYAANAPTPLAS